MDEGFVVLGGPVGDGDAGLMAVSAESEQAVEARFAEDPWRPMGLLRTASDRAVGDPPGRAGLAHGELV